MSTWVHEFISTWAHEYITGLLLSYWGTELSDVAGPTRPGGGVEISSGRVTQNSVTNCSIDPRRPQWNVRENNSSSTIVMPRDTPIQRKRAKGEECPLYILCCVLCTFVHILIWDERHRVSAESWHRDGEVWRHDTHQNYEIGKQHSITVRLHSRCLVEH